MQSTKAKPRVIASVCIKQQGVMQSAGATPRQSPVSVLTCCPALDSLWRGHESEPHQHDGHQAVSGVEGLGKGDKEQGAFKGVCGVPKRIATQPVRCLLYSLPLPHPPYHTACIPPTLAPTPTLHTLHHPFSLFPTLPTCAWLALMPQSPACSACCICSLMCSSL